MKDIPAFPETKEQHAWFPGMTLRDYFAAKAMQGWAANSAGNGATSESAARWAYEMADAMLKAREAKDE